MSDVTIQESDHEHEVDTEILEEEEVLCIERDEGEYLTSIIQNIFLTPKERTFFDFKIIFKLRCKANNKVYHVILNNESCKNVISTISIKLLNLNPIRSLGLILDSTMNCIFDPPEMQRGRDSVLVVVRLSKMTNLLAFKRTSDIFHRNCLSTWDSRKFLGHFWKTLGEKFDTTLHPQTKGQQRLL